MPEIPERLPSETSGDLHQDLIKIDEALNPTNEPPTEGEAGTSPVAVDVVVHVKELLGQVSKPNDDETPRP